MNKILVVDDSKTYLTFARAALEGAGFIVCQAEDIWVSRKIRDEQPDLILMDVALGASRGTNAVEAIKKCSFSAGKKILLHSGQSAETLGELARQCGADGFIVKDGNAANLARQVKSAMSGFNARAAVQA